MSETVLRDRLASYAEAVVSRLPDEVMPGRIIPVTPGTLPAWDDCCDGQLYGRVVQIMPGSERPPTPGGVLCGVPFWNVTLALGMLRCAATVEGTGRTVRMPTAAAVLADGHTMLDDMRVLHDAIMTHPETRSVVGWNPLDVEGGCHGGEWLFTTRLAVMPLSAPIVRLDPED